MASAIDATKPVAGNPTTESVRLNFAAAKSEIELLQQTAGVGPQGPVGPTGPSGTISVGTVTTGAAGTSASVTNTGSTTAATFNFTIPRGDAGTGGSGITETQAKDAVAAGNIKFLESPETLAVTFPTTPNLAGAPTVGANWSPATGGTATQAYTHDIGSTETLAYPAAITNGSTYQIVFSVTNVAATSTAKNNFLSIIFRTAPTTTTGQQTVISNVGSGSTVTIRATGNFSWIVVVPVSGWQGNFTMTRVVAFSGAQNSVTLSLKDWEVKVRNTSLYVGGGGGLATASNNVALGRDALSIVTTGNFNVCVGESAGNRITTGTYNTAIGPTTMTAVVTGSYNIALGTNNFTGSASGSYNIGMGTYALSGISGGGSYNIGIGYYALYYTAPANIGNLAISDWTWFTGNYNTALGYRAMAPTTAGPTEMIGSRNIAIGYFAGANATGTPGTYNRASEDSIFIGGNTKPADTGQTNQIVMGFGAAGHGSNTITLGNDQITHLHCHVQTISALSDSRVKENIQHANLDKCLTAVKNLPVSEWDWLPIAGPHPDKHDIGFVSDDVAKVFPQAISKEDRALTVFGADGKPEMTTFTQTGGSWTPPEGAAVPASMETLPIEKTQEFKGLQYISTSEMLPTLWGAVQKLIQQVEELSKKS